MYFTDMKPTFHYLTEHERDVPWCKVVELIQKTKNPRKRGKTFEIKTEGYYIVFIIRNQILYVINAKKVIK